ncbi:MAG: YciI family protein [Alphaproteobacteria bacterium]
MPEFVFAYHGGTRPSSPEEGAKLMKEWRAWMSGLGDAVVDPGKPVGKSHTVSAKGVTKDGGANPIAGFTVVKAASLDAAVAMAKPCPHVKNGGTIEVAEAMDMEM